MFKSSSRHFLLVAIILSSFGAGYLAHRTTRQASLADHQVANLTLRKAHVGLVFQDLETGKTYHSYQGEKNFIPASLTKLFTTAAALHVLGENFQFETKVLGVQGAIKDGTFAGKLLLKGSGDPTLTSEDLRQLAKETHRSGIARIVGQIEVSGYKYDDTTLIPHAEWEDFGRSYAPEVHALSVDGNAESIMIEPGESEGEAAKIICEGKDSCFKILNLTATTTNQQLVKPDIRITRGLNDNRVIISGLIPIEHPALVERIALHNPSIHAKQKFISYLIQEGVSFEESPLSESFLKDQTLLAAHLSPPIKEILLVMNKSSDNLAAELLAQAVSYRLAPDADPIAIESGTPAFDYIRTWGSFSPDGFRFTGGAGLSRHNLVSPQEVVDLLQKMYSSPFRKAFLDSLPIAGVDGSLASRFRGTFAENTLVAKTGTLSGVSGLAGYARTKKGKNICFCVIANLYREEADICRKEMDNLVLSILENH